MEGLRRSEKKKQSVDLSIKATWLGISKMYNLLGAPYDISHSIGFVLLNIDPVDGTPATKIAPLMGMEARSLTRMLKNFEEKGLIVRIPDKHDKRKVIIKLTDYGQAKREMSKQTVKVFQRRVEEKVSLDELGVFFHVMDQINDVIKDPKNHMFDEIRDRLKEYGITEDNLNK
ncbi:MarR family transcriptional regulator [Flammeovirga yaeyamensis]|uniref:MarR family transcriptional regulator n=1 Tax=Flammeovirga yaeyamensis TaxID=367791 RepID=A0AAX1N7H7_9BACT|nr:MarR family winged helix-turn-helix transcriptional regulator [Flammeovirga yaeyamensis]MBB3701429.1 DNA-binding MarR family transcriptional regulator [Flammeovirga yaeyamensis]NMF38539.1 winged helix-turn-helix transcriptional regulator [Flammeovirga yaeyamensis]QWG02381.1 MarR family transcriptional regulator [Flammeovirga yaeyamensis]